MKRILGISLLGLIVMGCARQEDSGYVSGSAPAAEQGSATNTNVSELPNTAGASTRLNSIVRTNAGPDTGVGASATASSGIGTASASGAAANESDAAIDKGAEQNNESQAPPAGTGAQNPNLNSEIPGNAGTTPQN